ncbi:hypothetical protein [Paradevosia shaoguanensis]|uniref:hypothetical protein n=1 Tax=Paradevosia shaoguanensis TaxID=1335043 RepID=UPI003C7691FB
MLSSTDFGSAFAHMPGVHKFGSLFLIDAHASTMMSTDAFDLSDSYRQFLLAMLT